MQNTEFGDTWKCLLNSMDFLLTKISHKEWWLPVRVPVFDDLQSFFNGINGLILENKIMMSQPDSQHLFLLLKRTVVMRIVWPYTWHPRGRCHCHICSIAFSVKLFDGQRGIFDKTEETLHGCPHHPGPLCSWNCLQHHSQILNHKCHYIYGRKICHWGFAFATPWLFPLHLFDRSLKICSLPLHSTCDCRYLSLWENTVGLLEVASHLPGKISIRTDSLKCLLISSTSVTLLFTKSWILVITLVSTAWLIPLAWVRTRMQ